MNLRPQHFSKHTAATRLWQNHHNGKKDCVLKDSQRPNSNETSTIAYFLLDEGAVYDEGAPA